MELTRIFIAVSIFIFLIQSVNATEIEYIIRIEHPEKHYAEIEIVVKDPSNPFILANNVYHGYYKIPILNFSAYDCEGNKLPVVHYFEGTGERKKECWRIESSSNKLYISYLVIFNNITKESGGGKKYYLGYLNRIFGMSCVEWFLLVPKNTVKDVKVKFILPTGWKAYTPWKKEGEYYIPDNTEHLALSVVAFGTFDTYTKRIGDTNVTIAVYSGFDDVLKKMLVDNAFRIFEYQYQMFNASILDRYLAIFTPNADDGRFIWGGEYTYSQGISIKQGNIHGTLRIYSHQIFHRWNAWKPGGMVQLSNEMYWISEGINVYYEDKILMELGEIDFFSETALYRYYLKYRDIAGSDLDMSVVEAGPKKTITKPSFANFIIYRKGALVAFLLDMESDKWNQIT